MTENVLTEEMLKNALELLKRPAEYGPIVLPADDYDLMKKNKYDMTNYLRMEKMEL